MESVSLLLSLILAVPLSQAPLHNGWHPITVVEVLGESSTPGLTRVRSFERLRGDALNGEWLAAWTDHKPAPGERLILFYARSQDSARVLLPLHTYPATEANIAYVRSHMQAGPRTRLIQFPLLIWIIVGAPVLALCAIFFQRRSFGLLAVATGIAGALIYETGVPKFTDIRVDWLLILPALLISAALAAFAWFRRPLASPRDPK